MIRCIKRVFWFFKCFVIFSMSLVLAFSTSYYFLNLAKPESDYTACVAAVLAIFVSVIILFLIVYFSSYELLDDEYIDVKKKNRRAF